MDGGEGRAHQYATPYPPPTQSRVASSRPMGPPQDRHVQTLQSPARTNPGELSGNRSFGQAYTYGYQDPGFGSGGHASSSSPMQGVELQYPGYMQEHNRSSQYVQVTQYPNYGQTSMLPPVQQSSTYDDMRQFQQQRQTAAMVMASHFSMPTYVQQGEHQNMTGNISHPPYLVSQSEQVVYPSITMSRPQLQSPFAAPSVEYQMLSEEGSQGLQEQDPLQEAWHQHLVQFQQQSRSVLDDITTGRVVEAGEKIQALTQWLFSSITSQGESSLHHDDSTQYERRISMWRDFNHCWEALGIRQKDITQEALRTRRVPPNFLTSNMITDAIDNLVALCDQIEQYGLVDYEMGVWEEQIISIFTICLDILQQSEDIQERHVAVTSS